MRVISISALPAAQAALVERAAAARANAYAPYSHFAVGAALLAASGRVFAGVNCENVSFGGTICAERAALTAAVTAGERHFSAVAVVADGPVSPCGLCRQMLREFGDMSVILAAPDGDKAAVGLLSELLPDAFTGFDPAD